MQIIAHRENNAVYSHIAHFDWTQCLPYGNNYFIETIPPVPVLVSNERISTSTTIRV